MGSAYQKSFNLLSKLPHCADITRNYCSRFCGILVVDGKFIKVKGYDHKIPLLYGIDYTTHDIPTYRMALSESYASWLKYFESLKLLNYPLKIVVSDDNDNIRQACEYVYPKAFFQLCHNHFKENIRSVLRVRTDDTYKEFMGDIQKLFSFKRSLDDFNRCAKNIFNKHKHDSRCLSLMLDIQKRRNLLLGYLNVNGSPRTNNLIECFNSHFQSRLKTTKGFNSFKYASLWVNGYILKRRFKNFTDCRGKFKKLNGCSSIEKSKKVDITLPTFSQLLGDQK